MPYLLDASAVVELMLDSKEILPRVKGAAVLDLTHYEVGAFFWKSWRVRRTLSSEVARAHLQYLPELLGTLRTLRCEELPPTQVDEVARGTGLSYYDSAYVAAAETAGLGLATADQKIVRACAAREPRVSTVSPGGL